MDDAFEHHFLPKPTPEQLFSGRRFDGDAARSAFVKGVQT